MSVPKTTTTIIEPNTEAEGEPTPSTAPEIMKPKKTVQTVQPRIEPSTLRPITTVD